MLTQDDLPDDVQALKALLIERAQEAAERTAELTARTSELTAVRSEFAALKLEHEKLQALVAELNRHRFGRRSETLSADQLALGLEDNAQSLAALDEEITRKTSAARRPAAPRARNLGSLPAWLPRLESVLDVADTTCPCCRAEMARIGEDVAERLDIVPRRLRVLVTRRPKYACRACETHQQMPARAHIVEGGLPSEALIAGRAAPRGARRSPTGPARHAPPRERSAPCDRREPDPGSTAAEASADRRPNDERSSPYDQRITIRFPSRQTSEYGDRLLGRFRRRWACLLHRPCGTGRQPSRAAWPRRNRRIRPCTPSAPLPGRTRSSSPSSRRLQSAADAVGGSTPSAVCRRPVGLSPCLGPRTSLTVIRTPQRAYNSLTAPHGLNYTHLAICV
jgi:transposase